MGNRSKGKHLKEKTKSNKKKVIFFFLIIVIVICLTENIEEVGVFCENIYDEIVTKITKTSEIIDIEIPDKMEDYDVLGIIVIDKIGIQKNILSKTTDDSLNVSVTKFYGPNLNEQGNFCITGHNYKETFADLVKLKIGDTFYIIDKANSQKITYKIYDMYTVNPSQLDCLNQETNGKKEVTLITCNPRRTNKIYYKSTRDINLKIIIF